MKKHLFTVLLEYVWGTSAYVLPHAVSKALLPGIYVLLDACGPFETAQLHALLDGTGQALLKTLHSRYTTEHKFTGKV